MTQQRRHKVLPGFGITLGYTVLYLSLIVLLPLSAAFIEAAKIGPSGFWEILTRPRVLASLKLSFGLSLAAALINSVAGLLVAWVLTRYNFPGRRVVDAAIDLPFALPTAVAGIALTAVYAPNGWLGAPLAAIGIKVAFAPLGIMIALMFVGLPFAVRTVQPILENLDAELEEAAATLGANRWTCFRRVVLPVLLPSVMTGFAMCFARGVGEYGSVVFISGNMPLKTEIAPLLIVTELEQYDLPAATAIAIIMLLLSFGLILSINILQAWSSRRTGITKA
jgi:sulfate/thiosulfate transport system permease protein